MNRAIIYIASGQEYIDEAARSAESIGDDYKKTVFSPFFNIPQVTIPKKWVESFSIGLLPDGPFSHWYLDCIYYLNDIFKRLNDCDQILLLDTDTYVCGDLSDFFTALERFDIVGTHAVGRETMLQRDDIPLSFPELHVGALAFQNNKTVEALFSLWLKLYQDNPKFYGNNDQGPLREALWMDSRVRLGILPAEFCFRYRWCGLITGPVRVLHGREHGVPYEQIAKEVNSEKGIRVYHRRELA